MHYAVTELTFRIVLIMSLGWLASGKRRCLQCVHCADGMLVRDTECVVLGQAQLVLCLTARWSLSSNRIWMIMLAIAMVTGRRECVVAGAGLEMAQHAVEEAQQAADTAHKADAHKVTQAAEAQALSRCPAHRCSCLTAKSTS